MNEKIREIYNQILQRLALVDFDKIWEKAASHFTERFSERRLFHLHA